jgi:hypothetical protein
MIRVFATRRQCTASRVWVAWLVERLAFLRRGGVGGESMGHDRYGSMHGVLKRCV